MNRLMFTALVAVAALGCEDASDPMSMAPGPMEPDPAPDPAPDPMRPDPGEPTGLAHPSCTPPAIQPVPEAFANYRRAGFVRYLAYPTSEGPVHIFAMDQISDAMMLRAYALLDFYLTDVPGSAHGANKAAVAAMMGRNGAALMLPNGAHEEGNEPPVPAQPLYQSEMAVEGSAWYQNNDFGHRDASFEEIFHLVHDMGIGTNTPGALPDYQAALLAEAEAAIADGRWASARGEREWIAELRQEGSLAQEYIASVIDSYYGLWGPWTETPGGMWGVYTAKTRAEVVERDPAGLALLEAFLPPQLTYEARLDPAFTGTFSMRFDADAPYTHKSQYLVNVTLTGEQDADLLGNAAANHLRGNAGDNLLDGGEGDDTAIFCQPRSAYTIERDGADLIVTGDGVDRLRGIEALHFSDGVVVIDAL